MHCCCFGTTNSRTSVTRDGILLFTNGEREWCRHHHLHHLALSYHDVLCLSLRCPLGDFNFALSSLNVQKGACVGARWGIILNRFTTIITVLKYSPTKLYKICFSSSFQVIVRFIYFFFFSSDCNSIHSEEKIRQEEK